MVYYHYFNKNFPIQVTDDTVKYTPYTFQPNGMIWEIESIFQFFSQINPYKECTVVDIGAQSGSYTLFAKYLPNAKFHSFEPFKQSFDLLNDNIKLNNIENVTTYNVALSNIEGKTILNTSKGHNGLHTLGATPLRFNDTIPIEVNTKTLDSFFYDIDRKVDIIKIDTEGWEFNILKGALNTLKKYKPIIQIEWVPINMKQCSIDENEFLKFLTDIGYREHLFWSKIYESTEEKLFVPII
jgi:FkbM family methyltransferase